MFVIALSDDADDHLQALSVRDQRTIVRAIETQLAHEPTTETRNRKPMRANQVAPWELRVGRFRVYYDVVARPHPIVFVSAIGVKERNIVRIGGEEIEL